MSNKKYFDGIDSLRASAAIMLVIGHMDIFLYFRHWKEHSIFANTNLGLGVDLFFVISGFVVFSSILPSMSILKNNFLTFWLSFLTRRFFRLAPICFCWLGILLTLSYLLPSPYFLNFNTTLHEAIGIVAYLYNYMSAFGFYLVKNAPLTLGYHHSLNTEEQFYLFLPLLLFFIRENTVFWVSLAIILIGFLFPRPLAWYYFRYDSFFYGIAFAQLLYSLPKITTHISHPIKILGLKIVGPVFLWLALYALIHAESLAINHKIFETAALISLFILMLVCFGIRPLISEKLDACLVYIGKRSYTLYLTHIPTFMIANALLIKLKWTTADGNALRISPTPFQSIFMAVGVFAILVLFVEISYRYIELPCRNFGKKLSAKVIQKDQRNLDNHEWPENIKSAHAVSTD